MGILEVHDIIFIGIKIDFVCILITETQSRGHVTLVTRYTCETLHEHFRIILTEARELKIPEKK